MPPQVLAFYQSRKDNNGKWWCHTRNAVLQEWEVLGHGVLCPAAPLRALRYSSAGGAHSKLGQDGRPWMSRCHLTLLIICAGSDTASCRPMLCLKI
jgi:hypothetical protein